MWGAPSSWRQLDTERARGRKSHLFDDTGQWWLGQTGLWMEMSQARLWTVPGGMA